MRRLSTCLVAAGLVAGLAEGASAGGLRGNGVLTGLYLPPGEGGPSAYYSPVFSSMLGAPRSPYGLPSVSPGLFPPVAGPTGYYPPQPVPRGYRPQRRLFRRW